MTAAFSSVLDALRLRPLRQVLMFEARPHGIDVSTGGAKASPLRASINPPTGERPLLARSRRRRQSTFTGHCRSRRLETVSSIVSNGRSRRGVVRLGCAILRDTIFIARRLIYTCPKGSTPAQKAY